MNEEQRILVEKFINFMNLDEEWNKWFWEFFEQNHEKFDNLKEMFVLFHKEIQPYINDIANQVMNHQLNKK